MHDAMLETEHPGGGSNQFSRCQELGILHSKAQTARHGDLFIPNNLCQTRENTGVTHGICKESENNATYR